MLEATELDRKLRQIEARLAGRASAFDSFLHGHAHLREVALLAGEIAAELGEDPEAALVAGLLHDCGRMDDGGGNQHAIDSAELARGILQDEFPHLDVERICDAIARHADSQTTDDPLAGALWDADRLTLIRLGKRIDERLISTTVGVRMARERNARMDEESQDARTS